MKTKHFSNRAVTTVKHGLALLTLLIACGCNVGTSASAAPVAFPPELQKGLALHLDADQTSSLVKDANGCISTWKDLSPAQHDAVAEKGQAPLLVPQALNGRPVVRFNGGQGLRVPALADTPGEMTVFIVFRRSADQASTEDWQRVISGWDGVATGDNKGNGFLITTDTNSGAIPLKILNTVYPDTTYRGQFFIGRNGKDNNQFLRGDIAEVLIYNQSFLTYSPIQKINDYLVAKWGVVIDTSTDWTRTGPLPTPPKPINDQFPLSDQKNTGDWKKLEALSDEFNGASLDATKWWDHNPRWYGRAPSRYLAQNVSQGAGKLGITMSTDKTLPVEDLYKNGQLYQDYAAASVVSKTPVRYGYFEIRAKAMNSAGSSAFWFYGGATDKQGANYGTEIDVFEIGGKAPGYENSYGMNAHVTAHPEKGDKNVSAGGTWKAQFHFADDYHVFGLEWTPDFIKYYVDGVIVRSVKNTFWKTPMVMIFDTEIMTDWLGLPNSTDLPSTFLIDYVRAWKNKETTSDWTQEFAYDGDPTKPTDITAYVRALQKQRKQFPKNFHEHHIRNHTPKQRARAWTGIS